MTHEQRDQLRAIEQAMLDREEAEARMFHALNVDRDLWAESQAELDAMDEEDREEWEWEQR